MTDYAGCSEDDLINITFEFCNTKETGAVPASVFIKYLEEVTGHSHENSKLLLLYNMLDPERRNVLVDRETFHAIMKTWIAICYQDCISETEADKSKTPANGALQYNGMLSFFSDENAEIFEGRPEEAEMAFDLNSSVEDLKYMNRKMTDQLLGIQKVVEMSEENCLQLTDEIVELRGRLTSMQKSVGNINYIYNELEDTKSKMANLHEENHVICGSVTNLKKQVESLATKLISLEENSTAHGERETSLFEALLFPHSQEHFQNILQEIKSQKNSIFQALMEEIEQKQKMGHSLVIAVQILANVCPFMELWNKVLKRLEMFLDSQLVAKSAWKKTDTAHGLQKVTFIVATTASFNNAELQVAELHETNEHLEQSLLEAEIHDSSTVNNDQCLFGRAKRVPKDHIGVSLKKTALQIVDAVSFDNQMLLHTDQLSVSVLTQTWKKLLEAGEKWGNLEGRLEAILEISRSLAKDKNNVLDEKKDSNKHISGHKIQPDQKKGKPCTTTKLKESALGILREFSESVPESDVANIPFIKALQLWISEGEGHFLTQEYSKEEKYNFQIEKKNPNSTQRKPIQSPSQRSSSTGAGSTVTCSRLEATGDLLKSTELMNYNDFNCSSERTSLGMENCYSVAQQCSVHQNNVATNGDEKYFVQEGLAFDMKNEKLSKLLISRCLPGYLSMENEKMHLKYPHFLCGTTSTACTVREDTVCCASTPLLPLYFPLTYDPTCYFDNDSSRLQTSLIEALNLEYTSTRKRCCWTFPNLFFLGQRQGSREHILNKRRHAYKTEHGRNNKRRLEVDNHPASTEDGVKHLPSKPLPKYSAVTQRSLDQKSPHCLSSEVNLKQTFPTVHGLFSPHCNSMCSSPLIMPTLPEDVGQPAETQCSNLSTPVKESPAEAAICSTPHIILPENTILPDAEKDTNLAFRPISPRLRHSNRHTRTSANSLTSVDSAGHVIDLLNDQLPDVKISDEDKKKNLELLEEAKRVSERFLTRRGRKSRSSLSESPTAISPTLSPSVSPAPSRSNSFTLPSPTGSDTCTSTVGSGSPLQNATKGLADQNQNDQRKVSQGRLAPCTNFENSKEKLSEKEENFVPHKFMDNLSRSCTSGSDTDRVSFNGGTDICENELGKQFAKKTKENNFPLKGHLQGLGMVTLDPKSKSSALLPKDSKVSCKTELNATGTRPPLLRAVSWDHVEPDNTEKAPFKPRSEDGKNFAFSKSSNIATKSSAFKDLQIQVQPIRMQKLTKLREEHKMMRNQNLVGLKLPDLSEAAEQERGSSPVPFLSEEEEETAVKSRCDVMPNISDALLRKLHVQTSLPGSSPPLTEKEVENVFVQLSLAFRNDSYTLESRINQAERERNLAEENTEKELDNFRVAITSSASLWHHTEHRDMYQKLLEDIAVLHRLSSRLSSRAEMVGAVRQEKRMSKATEVMMQYVENLKRTYEKDHAELMEFKKLANQNSSRSYGSPEDGVPRTSRSMSLSVGKMPRRRVSVAVVSKFELPGQSPSTLPVPLMPSLSESSNGRSNLTSTPVLPALIENGKSNGDPDCEPSPSAPAQSSLEEINPETKAKIEEEAYNKGYQEGLKKTKELDELKEDDEEKVDESPSECEASENDNEISKERSKLEVVIHYVQILYPKLHKHWNVFWIVAAIVVIFAVVLGISSLYNYFSSCTELSDGPQVKATCSAVQQYSWWSSGLQHDQRTE